MPRLIITEDFIKTNLKNIDWSKVYNQYSFSSTLIDNYIKYATSIFDIPDLDPKTVEKHYSTFTTIDIVKWICKEGYYYIAGESKLLDLLEKDKSIEWNPILNQIRNTAMHEGFHHKYKYKSDGSDYVYKYFDNDYIVKCGDSLNMFVISQNIKLSIEMIRKYKDKLDWEAVTIKYIQSNAKYSFGRKLYAIWRNWGSLNSLCIEFKDKVNWTLLCEKFVDIPENVLLEMGDYVDWDIVTAKYDISDHIIEKFKDNVNWAIISKQYKLDIVFVNKYKDKLDPVIIYNRIDITPDVKNKYKVILDINK